MGRLKGLSVEVVEKDFGDIRDDLKTVQPENAPDVIIGAHDWTGQLAADGLVLPLFPAKATRAQFPAYALDAFSYGTAVKRLYGAPVALENIGLVVNTKLAKVPKTFAQLESSRARLQEEEERQPRRRRPAGRGRRRVPHVSVLLGPVWLHLRRRTRPATSTRRTSASRTRRSCANAPLIDKWNKEGLINSKIDYGAAKDAFLKGQAAFWITGPWESDTLKTSGLRFKIVQVPAIKCKSVPFLGVQGFMVTKFAATHGVESAAKDLVGNYMMRAGRAARSPRRTAAPRRTRSPARRSRTRSWRSSARPARAACRCRTSRRWRASGRELGGAWVKSTKGAGATKARTAFTTAARNIANKIG